MVEKKKRATSAVGDDLSISIPSLFRCPISLDVMKSPVSLCTGVTYDRSSIQKWLDGGHDTCPATMQVLKSKDLVPNHTLHRIIQIWSDSASAQLNDSLLSGEQARELITEMRKDSSSAVTVENLEKVAHFCAESEENRRYLVRLDGFLYLLVDLMCNVDDDLAKQALKITSEIVSMEESEARKIRQLVLNSVDCISSLLRFLSKGSLDAKIASAKVLEIIASDAESKLLIAEKEGVLPQLVKFVDQGTDSSLMEAVLSCLISLSMVKRVKVRLVRLGLVSCIAKLLTNTTSSLISIERMLKLLETLSSCNEGRKEICEDPACVPAILTKMMKVSKAATENSVTILWCVCYLFRDEMAQESVARNKGLTKILLVMQSNCSAGVRQMAGDLLKVFRVNSKSCLWSYDTETTHITPF
ncbi:unnamed protein product [Rhodiola kirilowii]